jgi:hypothetical protein
LAITREELIITKKKKKKKKKKKREEGGGPISALDALLIKTDFTPPQNLTLRDYTYKKLIKSITSV